MQVSGVSTSAGGMLYHMEHRSGCRGRRRSIKRAAVQIKLFRYEREHESPPLITSPIGAFAIPASAWPIFFLAALVLPQGGWNFPGGQEFLWRDRGFLWANRQAGRLGFRNFCRRHQR